MAGTALVKTTNTAVMAAESCVMVVALRRSLEKSRDQATQLVMIAVSKTMQ